MTIMDKIQGTPFEPTPSSPVRQDAGREMPRPNDVEMGEATRLGKRKVDEITQIEANPMVLQSNVVNRIGNRTIYRNGSYEGEYENGIPNGTGRLEFDGIVYIGEISRGYPHGKGQFRFPDGSVYIGEVYEGRPHGIGEYRTGGVVYEGSISQGRILGQGSVTIPRELHLGPIAHYEGVFNTPLSMLVDLDEIANPTGRYRVTYRDGSTYEGELVQGRSEGLGKFTREGDSFEGYWHDNHPLVIQTEPITHFSFANMSEMAYPVLDTRGNGSGLIRDAVGNVYEGEIRDRVPHGKGKLTSTDGHILEGDFQEGQFVRGRMVLPNKFKFEGDFIPEFSGEAVLNSGVTCKGRFSLKTLDGEVERLTFPNGVIFSGTVSQMKPLDGRLTYGNTVIPVTQNYQPVIEAIGPQKMRIFYKDGSLYEGEANVVTRTPHGIGKFSSRDGSVYEGMFVDGVRQGLGTLSYKSGYYSGHFMNGKPNAGYMGIFESPILYNVDPLRAQKLL